MKRILLLAATLFTLDIARADLITQWTFNDTNVPASAPLPSLGVGAASVAGGITAAYVSGVSADKGGTNKAWNTKTYPAATAGNKTAGVQFNVSTEGYENISLSWYQENSSTASRYARLQYTVDGGTYVDADVIALSASSTFTNQTVTLGNLEGITNNPLFGFRIVTEFESTAAGTGNDSYVATKNTNTYSPSGTIHFDLVTVSGTQIPDGNTQPYIVGTIPDQTIRVTQPTSPLPFLVMDAESPATDLILKAVTSDPNGLPASNVAFGGSGANRTVTVTGGSQAGNARVTVWVVDPGGKSNNTSFAVTVLAANTAPVISDIAWTNTITGTAAPPVAFTVWDAESPAASLSVSAVSANPALLPNDPAHMALGGGGTNRLLTLTPASGQSGVAPVTVTVSDGTNSASSAFALLVRPSASVIFFDPFAYADGSLLTNSGRLWANRSGTLGQTQVTNQQVLITADQTEDVVAHLAGAPYAKGNGTVLYASLRLKCLALPGPTAGYFAHFGSGSYLRARIYAGTDSALPGCFRLAISNGTDTNVTQFAANLSTNVSYTVLVRYNIDAATATLWVNPATETDLNATATDTVSGASVSAFGFRQDASIGATLLLDDLRVGLSFAAVLPGTSVTPIPLAFDRNGNSLILRWTNPGFGLQRAPAASGTYTNLAGASSPYTNAAGSGASFFRLKAN